MRIGIVPSLAACFIALGLTLSPCGVATAADWQPSFSCARAARTVERMICTHAVLARADRELDDLYRRAVGPGASVDARKALRDEQRAWLKQRDQTCLGKMTIEQARQDLQPFVCLRDAYGDRIRSLRDAVSPPLLPTALVEVDTTAMDTPSGFRGGSFSADARVLAVRATHGSDEAARRVWLYPLDGKLPVAATPVLGNPDANSEAVVSGDIRLAWDGDTLYVRSKSGAGAMSVNAATVRGGSSRLATLSPEVEVLFRRARWYLPSEDDLARVQDDGMPRDGIFALGDYLVWLSDRSRGNIVLRLTARHDARSPVQDVAFGSWELMRLAFDRTHLIWPSRDGLMLLDLGHDVPHRIAGTITGDLPVAYDGASRMLAWASTRPCGSAATGSEADLDPMVPHPWLCLARLPASWPVALPLP